MYLKYLRSISPEIRNISATTIANNIGLGEVQVRKDLCQLCGAGKPKTGYLAADLTKSLEQFVTCKNGAAIIIGAGKLGRALLDYSGFDLFGLSIIAAFDIAENEMELSPQEKPILPMSNLAQFCKENNVKIGIISVPTESAQDVCNQLCDNGIKAIWCFAPCQLYKPSDVIVEYENLALSLAHLNMSVLKNKTEEQA